MKPKVHRTNHWYRIRLGKYFDEHYVEYEDSITWYTDPAPNVWVFNANISLYVTGKFNP